MSRLPETSREILQRHYGDGRPIAEIARENKPAGSIKGHDVQDPVRLKECIQKKRSAARPGWPGMRESQALIADYLDESIDAEDAAASLGAGRPAARAGSVSSRSIMVSGSPSRPRMEFVDAVVREVKLLGDADRFSQGVVRQIKQTTSRRRIWEMAAAALFLAIAGYALFRPSGVPAPAAEPPQVLFVVGRVPLDAGDQVVKTRLEQKGYRVLTKIESAVTEADARGMTFVAISSTSLVRDVLKVPGELMTKFRSVAVPVLTWEPRLFYDLGMIPGAVHHTDWAATRNVPAVSVVNPAHALAAGLSGRVALTTGPAQLSWGRARGGDRTRCWRVAGEGRRRLRMTAARVGLGSRPAGSGWAFNTPRWLTPPGMGARRRRVRWAPKR